MDLPFDPMVSLLGIYSKEPKTLIQKDTSIPMFIAALFTIAEIWKQPKCPSIDEWIKQPWNIYTMEYYSAVKEEEKLSLFADGIMLYIENPKYSTKKLPQLINEFRK